MEEDVTTKEGTAVDDVTGHIIWIIGIMDDDGSSIQYPVNA